MIRIGWRHSIGFSSQVVDLATNERRLFVQDATGAWWRFWVWRSWALAVRVRRRAQWSR